jgi:hypothetical protein
MTISEETQEKKNKKLAKVENKIQITKQESMKERKSEEEYKNTQYAGEFGQTVGMNGDSAST